MGLLRLNLRFLLLIFVKVGDLIGWLRFIGCWCLIRGIDFFIAIFFFDILCFWDYVWISWDIFEL